jgi:hypothetical protein
MLPGSAGLFIPELEANYTHDAVSMQKMQKRGFMTHIVFLQ